MHLNNFVQLLFLVAIEFDKDTPNEHEAAHAIQELWYQAVVEFSGTEEGATPLDEFVAHFIKKVQDDLDEFKADSPQFIKKFEKHWLGNAPN